MVRVLTPEQRIRRLAYLATWRAENRKRLTRYNRLYQRRRRAKKNGHKREGA